MRELDLKLGAIRGGARVDSRRTLDEAAESLRVAVRPSPLSCPLSAPCADPPLSAFPQASSKILSHLVSLLKPYTLSLSSPLSNLHAHLSAYKPLFDFLRRHAARQAHEFQKAYAQTARWYLETGFRRYVRALEKVRTAHAAVPAEPIGSVVGVADALGASLLSSSPPPPRTLSFLTSPTCDATALLQQRKTTSPAGRAAMAGPTPTSVALENAQVGSSKPGGIILAHSANDRSFVRPVSPRSCSLTAAACGRTPD